jgi:uncharacterized membrane protein YidH (DUF202 family)
MRLSKRNKKKKQETNIILIILGLILIFVIGYAFWQKAEKEKALTEPETPDEALEKLKNHLAQKETIKVKKEHLLNNLEQKRKKYFFYARLVLVLLMLGLFFVMQFWWKLECFRDTFIIDNLRNYISLIIIAFTTVAFVAKGNLKSFKESIEEMAISWFFQDEETLRNEIQLLDIQIKEIKLKISKIENDDNSRKSYSSVTKQIGRIEKCSWFSEIL